MDVPRAMAILPPDLREQVAWWHLVRAVQLQEGTIPLGPPTNIEWTVTSNVGEVAAVKLRHPCEECRDGLTQAIDALRSGKSKLVAVVQFSQSYLRDVRDLDTPYVARHDAR